MKSCTVRDKVCNKLNAASMATHNSVDNFSTEKERYFSGPPIQEQFTKLTEVKAFRICCVFHRLGLLFEPQLHTGMFRVQDSPILPSLGGGWIEVTYCLWLCHTRG